MNALRRGMAVLLSVYIMLGPGAGRAMAAVDAETQTDPAASGKTSSGAGTMASGLESFKTDLATGSASFGVPIEVPPGTAGMQPTVGLGYSSGAGNDWVGFGWTLDLGRISRRTQRGVPTYTASDEFQLGSTRLVLGTDGNYHTEIESFVRIKHLMNGSQDNGWEVVSKDGKKLSFGQSSSSRIADGTKIFAWLLDRVEDTFGNYLTVTYQSAGDAGNLYPRKVSYTYHNGSPENGELVGGSSSERRVEFCLEGSDDPCEPTTLSTRIDSTSNYLSGFRIETTRRLKSIRTYFGSSLVRRYNLQYWNPGEPSTGSSATSRLKSVQVVAADGTALPAMTLTYSPGAVGYDAKADWANPSGTNDPLSNNKYIQIRKQSGGGSGEATVMDLDGDGVGDRVTVGDEQYWNIYRAIPGGSGYGERETWGYWSGDVGLKTKSITDLDGAHVEADVIDLDGDTRPDRVSQRKDDDESWDVYWNNDGTQFTNPSTLWGNQSGILDKIYASVRRFDGPEGHGLIADVVDMNGDGLPDRVLGGKNDYPNPWKVYFNPGGRAGFSSTSTDWANPSVSDNNNNGYIQQRGDDGVFNEVVDLNGDGLPDKVAKDARTSWKVWFNTGSGFESEARDWHNESGDIRGNYEYIRGVGTQNVGADLVDVNGDGLPDRITAGPDNNVNFRVYLNLGNGFATTPILWGNPSGIEGYKHPRDLTTGGQTLSDFVDVNGDGLLDRVTKGTDDTFWAYYKYPGTKPDLLTKVENGLGGSVEIAYQASTQYLNAAGTARLNDKLPFPVQTVRKVARRDGVTANDIITEYTYADGFYETNAREFRGFKTVTAVDVDSYNQGQPVGTTTATTFLQGTGVAGDLPGLKGQVAQVEVKGPGGNTLAKVMNTFLSSSDPDWGAVTSGGGPNVQIALVKRTIATVFKANGSDTVTTAARFRYDAYGNVLEKVVEGVTDPLSYVANGDERKTCATYVTPGANYRAGFPLELSILAGDFACGTQVVSRTTFVYAQSSDVDGFWASQKVWLKDDLNGINKDVITQRTRDEYGNVRDVTDANNHTTTSRYDGEAQCPPDALATSTHTFPCLVTNAKGHTQSSIYKAGLGVVVKSTDPNGHQALTAYDGLGRTTSASFQASGGPAVVLRQMDYPTPGGGGVGGKWGVFSGADAQNVRTIDFATAGVTTRESGLQTQVFFDGLGRTTTARTDGDDQKPVDVTTTYDTRGRAKRRYLPFFNVQGQASPGYAEYKYDALGRATQAEVKDSSTGQSLPQCVTTLYDGLDTTVELRDSCDAGAGVLKRKATTRNAHSNVIEVREFNPVNTSTPYRTTYFYDTLDNLVQVRDACANTPSLCDATRPGTQRHVTTIEYDTLSRKIRATDPDMGTWTYRYDDVGNLVYQKDAKPGVFPNEIWFTYDELNREILKNFENASQTDIAFTYDQGTNGLGRLRQVTDQAGTVKYEYDPRGNMAKFTRDYVSTGKRLAYDYAYDNMGRITNIGYPKETSGLNVAAVTYNYSNGAVQTPLVESISWVNAGGQGGDVVKPGTEYDAAGRLKHFVDGTNVETTLGFNDLTGQMTANAVKVVGGASDWWSQEYDYHQTTGSITHVRNVGNEITDQDYGKDFPALAGYDALGRLTGAVGPWQPNSLGVSATYVYDAIGNMVTKDQIASYPAASKTLKYEHATSPHAVTRLTTGDGVVKNYAYDANGNMIQRIVGGTIDNFEWDQDNRLLRMRQGNSYALREFVYDYTGERVKASSASTGSFYTPTRDFDWDGAGSANLYVFLGATRVASFGLAFSPPPISGGVSVDWEALGRGLGNLGMGLWPFLAMLLGLGLTRWWLDPRRAPLPVLAKRIGVAVLVLSVLHATARPAQAIGPPFAGHWNTTLYYHADYKGSEILIAGQTTGEGVQGIDYWPYGAMRGTIRNPNYNVDVRHKFTDQELDDFLGFYYYGGRWYDPEAGRFISPDPFVQAPKNPQSLNRYSYVINNPTNLVDPTGYFFGIDDLFLVMYIVIFATMAAATGAAIGAVVGGIVAAFTGSPIGPAIAKGALYGAVGGAAGFAGGIVGGMLAGSIAGTLGASQAVINAVSTFTYYAGGGAVAGTATAAVGGDDLGRGAIFGAVAAIAIPYVMKNIKELIKGTLGIGGLGENDKTYARGHENGEAVVEDRKAHPGVEDQKDTYWNESDETLHESLATASKDLKVLGPFRLLTSAFMRSTGLHHGLDNIRYDHIHVDAGGNVHWDRFDVTQCAICHFLGDVVPSWVK